MDRRDSDDVVGRRVEDVGLWLAAIVDSSDDAIISKSLDGVILTWNPAAQRLFGDSQEEAVGQPITIIIPPELRDEEQEILRRLRAGVRIEHHETRRLTRDGRYLDVSLTISPVKNAEGIIVGASKILRDVTESKRARKALRESQQRLAGEVVRSRTLQAIITRLMSESTQDTLFAQILDAAIELLAADAASVQMLAPDGRSLALLGWRNFHPDSAAFWQRVTAEAGSTCGRALRDNARVLVTDIDTCEYMAGRRRSPSGWWTSASNARTSISHGSTSPAGRSKRRWLTDGRTLRVAPDRAVRPRCAERNEHVHGVYRRCPDSRCVRDLRPD
jgi:PAS domain S-box-containing protein